MMNKLFTPLTSAMLEEFRDFLDKQEAKLADALMLATIPPLSSTELVPLHLHGSGHFRLSQALQVMTSRIWNLHEGQTTPGEWRSAVVIINQAFWDYVEILESASQELFQYLDSVDINSWSEQFYMLITSFKELLVHRIEDLIWVYRRTENLLLTYRSICKKRKNFWVIFGKLLSWFSNVLDGSILTHLSKADENLTTHYKNFSVNFGALKTFIPEIQEKEVKFFKFPVFPSLEQDQKNMIIRLYRLIAMNEKNAKIGTLNQELLITAMKNLAKSGPLSLILRDYYLKIRQAFFHYCLEWQIDRDPSIKTSFHLLEMETDHFKALIGSYREILMRSESDFYAKTRWWLTEWIVGPEPRKTRHLLHLLYKIDALKKLFSAINKSLESTAPPHFISKKQNLKKQIDEVLHEMGQPLTSRNLIQVKAERLIDLLDAADELGGSHGDVRPLMTEVFLKALHFDSKYQVLNDYPRFEELYEIHQGLRPPLEDLEHDKRIKFFQTVTKHVTHWLKKRTVQEHIRELDLDETAVQENLQRLLAQIQRYSLPADGRWVSYFQMLLEYRYLFSQFFHFLRAYDNEGKLVRAQFIFVDQYLDAMEHALKEEPVSRFYG